MGEDESKLTDYLALYEELDASTDRAFAILCGVFLEEKLATVLRAFLVKDSPVIKELFDQDGPLGTFSSKSKMAYALGLLSANEYSDMKTIRIVRNKFAHSLHGLSFADEKITNQCRELKLMRHRSNWIDMSPRKQLEESFVALITRLAEREVIAQNKRFRRTEWPNSETAEEHVERVYGVTLTHKRKPAR